MSTMFAPRGRMNSSKIDIGAMFLRDTLQAVQHMRNLRLLAPLPALLELALLEPALLVLEPLVLELPAPRTRTLFTWRLPIRSEFGPCSQ